MSSPVSLTTFESEDLAALASIDIAELVKDREAFNALVYTDVEEAIATLRVRKLDTNFPSLVYVPKALREGLPAVMFRQVFTPNYEIRRFLSITEALSIVPIFWEYHTDKFTSNNEWKHALGKLHFYAGSGKKGGAKIDTLKIIDFNRSNGKPIRKLKTLWGQTLISFHHELIKHYLGKLDMRYYDASGWFKRNGRNAYAYYKSFISLFVKDAILFENFMLEGDEGEFTRDIFLPAFISVWRETGHRPLIVSLEPTDIEGDRFWLCYPNEDRAYIEKKLARGNRSIFKLFRLWT